jgi:hypothetical protein
MADSVIRGDFVFRDNVSFGGGVNLPISSVTNENIEVDAQIDAGKLVHRHPIQYGQKNAADVASETIMRYIAGAAGEVVSVVARVTTAPTGGDKQFTVKVQKAANASGSWTDILTAPITFAAGDANDTLKVGTLTGATYNGTDALRIVITASGTTGSQGQGLEVMIFTDELAA